MERTPAVKSHHRASVGHVLALALALGAAPAAADEGHGVDLFGGYSFARIGETDRHGGNLALGFDVGPLAAFVDTSFHWGSQAEIGLHDLTLMAGPGARFGKRGGTVIFVRILAGLVRDQASIGVLDVEISEGTTDLGFLGGGGVDFRIGSRLAARVQADYLLHDTGVDGIASCPPGVMECSVGSNWSSGYRVSVGITYRFGKAP
jgi:hypothetical protein